MRKTLKRFLAKQIVEIGKMNKKLNKICQDKYLCVHCPFKKMHFMDDHYKCEKEVMMQYLRQTVQTYNIIFGDDD